MSNATYNVWLDLQLEPDATYPAGRQRSHKELNADRVRLAPGMLRDAFEEENRNALWQEFEDKLLKEKGII